MNIQLLQNVNLLRSIVASFRSFCHSEGGLNTRNDTIEIQKVPEGKPAYHNPPFVDLFGDFVRRVKTLTPTERIIFNYCIEGKSNKEILGLMYISLSTLRTHNSHIYAKLNVASKDELFLYIQLIKKSGRLSDICPASLIAEQWD